MSWTDEQLGVLAGSEEIEIETTDRDHDRGRTPIWIVRVGDELYVRAADTVNPLIQ